MGYLLPAFSLGSSAADQQRNVRELLAAVRAACADYSTPVYCRRQQACMALDVSWDGPAAEWEAFLRATLAQQQQRRLADAGQAR